MDLSVLDEELSLEINHADCENLNQIVNKLGIFKNLKHLGLQIINQLNEQEFSVMMNGIQNIIQLKSLQLYVNLKYILMIKNKKIFQQGAIELEKIGQLKNLENLSLNLSYFQIKDSDIKYLAQILNQCASLKQVEFIIPHEISSFGFIELGQSLSQTSNLRKLLLKLKTDQVLRLISLAQTLAKNQKIQDLSIIIVQEEQIIYSYFKTQYIISIQRKTNEYTKIQLERALRFCKYLKSNEINIFILIKVMFNTFI
ncbi:hypothetical protein ABPG72_021312 [Tetrahymena utriculariae]